MPGGRLGIHCPPAAQSRKELGVEVPGEACSATDEPLYLTGKTPLHGAEERLATLNPKPWESQLQLASWEQPNLSRALEQAWKPPLNPKP